jgi:GTP cyclohydrolase I
MMKKVAPDKVTAALSEVTNITEWKGHMEKTPQRWAAMMADLTTREAFEFTTFDSEHHREMVIVDNIPFYSLCAHHLIPFFGKCHVAYIPNNRLVGLSKIPRTVRYFMRGLQVQEKLSSEIADFLVEKLEPMGVAVVLKGEHLCMSMRGIESQGSMTTTSAMRGVFLDNENTARAEFLNLLPS